MSGANGKHALVGYVERVEIESIRSIASLKWEVTPEPGWNVVLGDNGSGKSTFLRTVAMVLSTDRDNSLALGLADWIRSGRPFCAVCVTATTKPSLERIESAFKIELDEDGAFTPTSQVGQLSHLFSAGFGPSRRFTGGDLDDERRFAAFPRLARYMTLSHERVSLRESLAWLKLLKFKQLEQDQVSATLLASIRAFVNQDGFLPNGASLDRVTSDDVLFKDGNGAEVPVENLSDGYRSILSLTFELIRHLAAHYGAGHVFNASSTAVIAPGIVLIDEVDAHLHPSWQRQIGRFLRKCFPGIQFIVTTHSPIICQAATGNTDTVFRLPRPGTDEEGHMVTGAELGRLLYGDLADAYATDAMGHIGRSEKAYALLDQLAGLNRKEIDAGLSDDEQKEQRRLRRIFGSGPLPERHP